MPACLLDLALAKPDCGLESPAHWIWCGSVIRDSLPHGDGRYHLFASRWPKSLEFSPHWVTNSEIIRATSDQPEGPYAFEEIIFPKRDRRYFDALVTHNPRITCHNGTYYLYYIGITYDFETPDAEHKLKRGTNEAFEKYRGVWKNKRIGVATSQSIRGPWQRPDAPLLQPRPGQWDGLITSNPAVAIREDGFTAMVYKSRGEWDSPLQLGIATAPMPNGPFERLRDEPILPFNCEDPFLWLQDGRYHLIFKDFSGSICGVPYGGAYAWSDDLLKWNLPDTGALAYERKIAWSDGKVSEHGSLERASLLFENGKATHFIAAGSVDKQKMWETASTKIFAIPLRGA